LNKLKDNNLRNRNSTIKNGASNIPLSQTVKQEPDAMKVKNENRLDSQISGYGQQYSHQQTYFTRMKDEQDRNTFNNPNTKTISGIYSLKGSDNKPANNAGYQYPPTQTVKINPKITNGGDQNISKAQISDLEKEFEHEKSDFDIELVKQLLQEQSDFKHLKNLWRKEAYMNKKNPLKETLVTPSNNTQPFPLNAVSQNDIKNNAPNSVIPRIIEVSKPTRNSFTYKTGKVGKMEMASDEGSRSPQPIINQLHPINIESEVDEMENKPQKGPQSDDLPQEYHEQFHKSLVHPTTESPPEQQPALSREERISPFNQNRRNNDFSELSNSIGSSPVGNNITNS
jgi:hypothetical protein